MSKKLPENYKSELDIKDHSMNWNHDAQTDLMFKCDANYPKWFNFIQKVLKRLHIKLKDLELDITIEHSEYPSRTLTLLPGDEAIIHHNYCVDISLTRPSKLADFILRRNHFPLRLIFNNQDYEIKQNSNCELTMSKVDYIF